MQRRLACLVRLGLLGWSFGLIVELWWSAPLLFWIVDAVENHRTSLAFARKIFHSTVGTPAGLLCQFGTKKDFFVEPREYNLEKRGLRGCCVLWHTVVSVLVQLRISSESWVYRGFDGNAVTVVRFVLAGKLQQFGSGCRCRTGVKGRTKLGLL